jgi:hypothetical protein
VVIQFSPDSARGQQMRGRFQDQGGMFSYIHPEKRIPANHPLRKIRELVREVFKELQGQRAFVGTSDWLSGEQSEGRPVLG